MLELSYISYLFYKGYAEQGRSPHAGFAERSYVKLTFLDVARLCRAKLPTATPYKARSAKHCRSVAGDRVKAIATKPFLGLIAVLVWRGFAERSYDLPRLPRHSSAVVAPYPNYPKNGKTKASG